MSWLLQPYIYPDIFQSFVVLETTAANPQVEAPTSSIAREVEANAWHAKDVVLDAASTTQVSIIRLEYCHKPHHIHSPRQRLRQGTQPVHWINFSSRQARS